MSFSGEIKEELSKITDSSRHCRLAELAAIISGCGQVMIDEEDQYELEVRTENVCLARKYYSLVKKLFGIQAAVILRKNEYLTKTATYHLVVDEHEDAVHILNAVHVLDEDGFVRENVEYAQKSLLERDCCKRAYIRGAFLTSGSVSDPQKSYHLEIVCQQKERAQILQQVMRELDMDARIVTRKKSDVVYLKEGEQILSFLGSIGATQHLFAMENVRILKEMRNNLNRQVNCEAANLNKTVSAAVRQIEDIHWIEACGEFKNLPPNLREMAEIRLEYPDVSLKELGELLTPPVGKSGVNHRLRKLGEIAEKLRNTRQM